MEKIKILIVDDHRIIRDGLKSLLLDEKDMVIVAEAENGNQAIKMVAMQKIDVALMDIQMDEMNGITATQIIKEKFPQTKVLALSMFSDFGYISKMLKAGATGYILKNADKTELTEAVRKVAKGESYFSFAVNEKILDKLRGKKQEPSSNQHIQLSDREKEILKLIAEGLINKEIALKVSLSPLTVDTHRKNLLRKLNVKNTAGLVRYAMENGLLE